MTFGGADVATMVTSAAPLPVTLISESLAGNLDVVVSAPLPAGTNNIGDVDVLTVVPGTGPTNLGKAEDDPHATGDVGVQLLAVRTDTPVNRSGLDGDYEPLQISGGRLWTSGIMTGAIPAGNNNIGDVDIASLPNEGQQTMANSISVAIASDQTAVPVSGTVALGAGAASIGTLGANSGVDIGDVTVNNAAGAAAVNIQDGGNSITVDGTVAVSGTVTTQSNASLVDDAAFAPGTSRVVMAGAEFDDATPDSVDEGDAGALRMSANRNLYTQIRDLTAERSASVTAANALKVDNSAVTQPISGTVTANAGTGSFISAGDIAHDAPDSGNPVKVGAVGRTTLPTAVTDGDRVNLLADVTGRLIVAPWAPLARLFDNRIVLASTTETLLVAAGGAGVFRHIMGLVISNESATEVRVDIADGASVGATADRLSIDLAADGGGAVVMVNLPLKMGTANHLWSAQLSAAVASVYITVWYFEAN